MVGGLVGLMLAFMAAHVLSIAPFMGFFTGLLAFIGSVITFVAIQIGFGAVILTRAGRRREYSTRDDPDAAWEAAMNVDVDIEIDPEPETSTRAEAESTKADSEVEQGEKDDA
jgi:hypothetical protein